MGENIYTRQNDKNAIIFRKASSLCYRRERLTMHFVIAMSITLCLLSILNRYVVVIFKEGSLLRDSSASIGEALILVSGIVIIFQIVVNRYANRMHVEGANFEERYDNHVFLMVPNRCNMRPISDTNIEMYASKVKRPKEFFTDYYFDTQEKATEKYAQFKNYCKIFEDQYRLMLNVKGFFQTVWIGFIVLVLILAGLFNDRFLRSMTNILIPSLSIISLIMSSWYTFDQTMRFLQNALNITKELEQGGGVNAQALNSSLLMRSLQDSLFNFRLKSFTVPMFLVRRYEKRMARLEWGDAFDYRNQRYKKKQQKIESTIMRTKELGVEVDTVAKLKRATKNLKDKNKKARIGLSAGTIDEEILKEIRRESNQTKKEGANNEPAKSKSDKPATRTAPKAANAKDKKDDKPKSPAKPALKEKTPKADAKKTDRAAQVKSSKNAQDKDKLKK